MKSAILVTLLAALYLGGSQVNGAAVNFDDETSKNIDFGTAFKMYNLALHRIMPCGYPPLGIPILAPFTMDYYAMNFTNEYYNILGNVSNLVVTGLNNFRILGGTFNSTNNRTTFDLIYPEVQILGEYEMNAMAVLAGFPVEMAGSGLLNVKIIDFRELGEFSLAPTVNGVQVTDFNFYFSVGDVIFNNWNTLWDISYNNFVNNIAREFMLMWIQQIQVEVDEIFAKLLLPSINGLLKDVSMPQLIDFFVTEAIEFNSANCSLA